MMRLYDYLPSASTRRVGSYLPRAGGLGEGPVRTFRQLRRIVATTPHESVGMTRRVG